MAMSLAIRDKAGGVQASTLTTPINAVLQPSDIQLRAHASNALLLQGDDLLTVWAGEI